jgi:TatD DNase family protein
MIDTHCHIDEEAFDVDREEVIARQKESGVQAMIVPGVNVASIQTVLDVCHRHPQFCFPALGLHPEDVKETWESDLAVIEAAIRTHRDELVAIGEIGLDYYWDKTYKEQQKEVLRRQLSLARELNLPVILHNREATEDILTIVSEFVNPKSSDRQLTGVFHCFNGSRETAQQILDMGFYLGIGGVLTFKNCKLADTLATLNSQLKDFSQLSTLHSKLLLETDAPYMSPVPHRGERNESRFMDYVAERLAQTLHCTKNDVIEATNCNAKQLFFQKIATN